MKTIHKYTYLLIVALLVFSCSNDDDTTPPENLVVTINSISPTSGPKTTIVTISGNHFGEDLNAVQVFFNEKEATVNQVSNTEITAVVPPKAFTGNVTIKVNDTELTGPEFNYTITDVQVSGYAGSIEGDEDGTTASALFNSPTDGVFDSQGNLFFVDSHNHKIRMITPEENVLTLVGSVEGNQDGYGVDVQFRYPHSITIDSDDNLYVSEPNNYKIRKITPNGLVSTFAGGTLGNQDGEGTEAKFNGVAGMAIDANNNVYVADRNNHTIRKITPSGVVSTFAGSTLGDEDGNLTSAKFKEPTSICFDTQGNLLVADSGNHKIKKITPDGTVSTFAGSTIGFEDGSLLEATFSVPYHIKSDADNNLFVIEHGNKVIRKISNIGVVSKFTASGIGNEDGVAQDASFNYPYGLFTGKEHTIYVFDSGNNRIRKITQE